MTSLTQKRPGRDLFDYKGLSSKNFLKRLKKPTFGYLKKKHICVEFSLNGDKLAKNYNLTMQTKNASSRNKMNKYEDLWRVKQQYI